MIRFVTMAVILFASAETKGNPVNHFHSDPRIINIIVTSNGQAISGNDTLSFAQLTTELQTRLWKSYLGNGKMYDSIHLQYNGEVSLAIKNTAKDAVQKAQQKALTDVCLEKHRKLFNELDERQQNKIKKQFPVLFQSNF